LGIFACLQDAQNDEVLWRLARAAVDLGKHLGDDKIKKEKYYEAFEYIKQALELNDNNSAVHKVSILETDFIFWLTRK